MSDQSTPKKKDTLYSRVNLLEHQVLVPSSPLDVIPPTWSHFIPVLNMAGPRKKERLIDMIKKGSGLLSSIAISDRFLCCIVGSDEEGDDSKTVVMVSGFEEGQDVAIWITSNFAGPNANKPFFGSIEVLESGEEGDGPIDLAAMAGMNIGSSAFLDVEEITPNDQHLVGVLGVKSADIEEAIDSMDELLQHRIVNFGVGKEEKKSGYATIRDAPRDVTDREKMRCQILGALLDTYASLVITSGASVVPSMHFASSGVAVTTTEVCPQSRSEGHTERFALSAFLVFNGKVIMRAQKLLDEAIDKNLKNIGEPDTDGEYTACRVGIDPSCLHDICMKKTEELSAIASKNGRPETDDDIAMSLFLGSAAARYMGTRGSNEPPPTSWCMFNSFVAWCNLAKILAETGDTYEPWNISYNDKYKNILSNDMSDMTFGALTDNGKIKRFSKDGKEEVVDTEDELGIDPEALEQLKLIRNMMSDLLGKITEDFDKLNTQEDADAYTAVKLQEIMDATNNMDKCPSQEDRDYTVEKLRKMIHTLVSNAASSSTVTGFFKAMAEKIRSKEVE